MIPCPSCSRFVRTDAPHCPFCGSGVHTVPSPLAKAAMGVILGLTLSACGGAETEDTSGSTTNLEAEVSAYAAPEVDTGFEDSTIPPDQTTDDGGSSSTMTDSGSSGSGGSDSTSASSTADGGTGTGSGTGSTGDSGTGGSGSSG